MTSKLSDYESSASRVVDRQVCRTQFARLWAFCIMSIQIVSRSMAGSGTLTVWPELWRESYRESVKCRLRKNLDADWGQGVSL